MDVSLVLKVETEPLDRSSELVEGLGEGAMVLGTVYCCRIREEAGVVHFL